MTLTCIPWWNSCSEALQSKPFIAIALCDVICNHRLQWIKENSQMVKILYFYFESLFQEVSRIKSREQLVREKWKGLVRSKGNVHVCWYDRKVAIITLLNSLWLKVVLLAIVIMTKKNTYMLLYDQYNFFFFFFFFSKKKKKNLHPKSLDILYTNDICFRNILHFVSLPIYPAYLFLILLFQI